ncbi:MAG: TolC family protein [Bacteroidia bacterium]
MRKGIVYCFILAVFLALPSFCKAQKTGAPWSLQQCIDYALKNNLQVRQTEIVRETNVITLTQDRANLFPNLNGQANHNYNFGRTIDLYTNTFANDLVLSENFALSSGLVLFSGWQKMNTIKQGQFDLMASKEDVEKMKNDISLNIANAYLQILFNDELLTVAVNQVGISQIQVDRTRKLVDAGAQAKGNLLQMQAQLATDELSEANARNQVDLAYLNLVQLLDMDSTGGFNIVKPELGVPSESLLNASATQIYDLALKSQPMVKSAEYKLKSYDMQWREARGSVSPRLSMNVAIGTGYSGANKELVGLPTVTGYQWNGDVTTGGQQVLQPTFVAQTRTTGFTSQLSSNFNRSVGFSLTVPIFNGLQTYSNVERARLQVKNADLNLQIQKLQLRKTIQQAYADAHAALIKFQATKRSVDATQESFKYADQKFNVGLLNSLDYNDAKNKLVKAQSDLLQAKYDYIFKVKVLDFYQGKPLSF